MIPVIFKVVAWETKTNPKRH